MKDKTFSLGDIDGETVPNTIARKSIDGKL